MMHGNAIWKPEIREIAKASSDSAPCEPPAARWVMAYGYKTQSFMKNGGQQKRVDKYINIILAVSNLIFGGNH